MFSKVIGWRYLLFMFQKVESVLWWSKKTQSVFARQRIFESSWCNKYWGYTHIHNIDAKRCRVDNDSTTFLWHCRLGHIGVKRMKNLHTDGLLESLDFESPDTCEPCLIGKMTKTPFSGTMERASDLLEITHADVCGPMSVDTRSGYRYFLTFTDELSRYGYIYLMKHKSETFWKVQAIAEWSWESS